jgi:Tetratricopeptide repeat
MAARKIAPSIPGAVSMRHSVFLSVVLSVGFVPAVASAQQVGDKIVATAEKASLRANDAETGTVLKGQILTVKNVNGDWFWVIVSNPHATVKGWINRSDVIPYSQALDFFNEELKRNPTGSAYNNRANIWDEKGEHDIAIGDYNEAIRLDPAIPEIYNNRGRAWSFKGEFGKAIADYNEAIRLDPKYLSPWNNRSWLEATCPDVRFRDGKKAVEDANRALELAGSNDDPDLLATLAAAYAEAGDFDATVKWQTKAVELAAAGDQKARWQSRLDLYKGHKPYREEPKK